MTRGRSVEGSWGVLTCLDYEANAHVARRHWVILDDGVLGVECILKHRCQGGPEAPDGAVSACRQIEDERRVEPLRFIRRDVPAPAPSRRGVESKGAERQACDSLEKMARHVA